MGFHCREATILAFKNHTMVPVIDINIGTSDSFARIIRSWRHGIDRKRSFLLIEVNKPTLGGLGRVSTKVQVSYMSLPIGQMLAS